LPVWSSCTIRRRQSSIPKCKLRSFEAVLHQECELAYNIAIENYNTNLRQHFQNRSEPFEVEELFAILQDVRTKAIEEFGVSAEVREKYTSEITRNVGEEMNEVEFFTKELERRKREVEQRTKLVQAEKYEKERHYTNLAGENDKIAREINRLNAGNFDKQDNIKSLQNDIEDQKRAKAEMETELEKLKKRRGWLCFSRK